MPKICFPSDIGFNFKIALELSYLIERAYQQYQAFLIYKKEIKRRERIKTEPRYIALSEYWQPARNRVLTSSCHDIDIQSDQNNQRGELRYKVLDWFTIYDSFILDEVLPIGFIVERDIDENKAIFIIFRGTLDESEWLEDIHFSQVPFLNLGLVSLGFNRLYCRDFNRENEPPDTIMQLIDRFFGEHDIPETSQIFIAGHSLGGALATLAAAHVASAFQRKVKLYTFASPRVGDKQFADTFSNLSIDCYRIANTEDLVPTLPPSTLTFFGPEMVSELKPLTTTIIKGLRNFTGIFIKNVNQQNYQHVGYPIYFTDNKGYVSLNHNMYDTYRRVLLET